MQRFVSTSIVVLSVLLSAAVVAGCNSRRGGRPRDGGPTPVRDGGPTPTRDGGGIVIRDGGPMPGLDGGGGGCTSSAMCPSGHECSGGRCVPVGPGCRSMPVASVPGVYCTSTTRACVMACATGECIFDCLERDSSPDCSACALTNLVACFTANGCQSAWDCWATCVEDNCPEGSPSTCGETFCPTQRAGWSSCQERVGATCGTSWTSCLPAG